MRALAGEVMLFDDDERIVIITYARFGMILETDPDFHTRQIS